MKFKTLNLNQGKMPTGLILSSYTNGLLTKGVLVPFRQPSYGSYTNTTIATTNTTALARTPS